MRRVLIFALDIVLPLVAGVVLAIAILAVMLGGSAHAAESRPGIHVSLDHTDALRFGPSRQVAIPSNPNDPEGADHVIKATRVDHGHLRIMMRDGSIYDMAPCRNEDSRRCWWDAYNRGNRIGTPFIRLHLRQWSTWGLLPGPARHDY